jgi:hypothetical protein
MLGFYSHLLTASDHFEVHLNNMWQQKACVLQQTVFTDEL